MINKVEKEVLEKWLIKIYIETETANLENAIGLAKMIMTSKEEFEMVNMLSILYRSECSGQSGVVKMRELYSHISKGVHHAQEK